jgi:hypothetical protein
MHAIRDLERADLLLLGRDVCLETEGFQLPSFTIGAHIAHNIPRAVPTMHVVGIRVNLTGSNTRSR